MAYIGALTPHATRSTARVQYAWSHYGALWWLLAHRQRIFLWPTSTFIRSRAQLLPVSVPHRYIPISLYIFISLYGDWCTFEYTWDCKSVSGCMLMCYKTYQCEGMYTGPLFKLVYTLNSVFFENSYWISVRNGPCVTSSFMCYNVTHLRITIAGSLNTRTHVLRMS